MRIKDVRVGMIVECDPSRHNPLVFREPENCDLNDRVPTVGLQPGQKALCYYKSSDTWNCRSGHVTRWVTVPNDDEAHGQRFEIDSCRYWESHRGLKNSF